jgi:3-deoxy-7-phosphoheptulonate synthase
MIVVMNPSCSSEHVGHISELLGGMGVERCIIRGSRQTVIEVLGANGELDRAVLEGAPMVERVVKDHGAVLATGRKPNDETLEIPLGSSATIGGRKLAIIAGPCSVESKDQLLEIAIAVKQAGAVALRGGAFKPRTSPYSFQGHGERGLEMLASAGARTGLAIVTEVMSCEEVSLVSQYADVLQIGSRNMHNTTLLRAVGQQNKPVLLKRGWSATLKEFFLAAEYVLAGGNPNVILCERGIRTHEDYVRNTLALATVPEVKRLSNLPIIVDPSHGTGRRHLVASMSYAATACGADGLLIEVHHDPAHAWTDADQTLDLAEFSALMKDLNRFAEAAGRII